jgi:hypothetical protein
MNWVAADLPAHASGPGTRARELFATDGLLTGPLPAYAGARVAGRQETGMRAVMGCGGCAGSAP